MGADAEEASVIALLFDGGEDDEVRLATVLVGLVIGVVLGFGVVGVGFGVSGLGVGFAGVDVVILHLFCNSIVLQFALCFSGTLLQ